jgi:hypothetical protein
MHGLLSALRRWTPHGKLYSVLLVWAVALFAPAFFSPDTKLNRGLRASSEQPPTQQRNCIDLKKLRLQVRGPGLVTHTVIGRTCRDGEAEYQ